MCLGPFADLIFFGDIDFLPLFLCHYVLLTLTPQTRPPLSRISVTFALTNKKTVLSVLTNEMTELRVLTNEKTEFRILTNEKTEFSVLTNKKDQ